MTMTLQQALQYLISGGAVVLGAAFVSWLADAWPRFRDWDSPAGKQLVMVGVCLVLSLGAWAIQKYVPAATLEDLSVPFGIAVATIAAVLGNQWFHANVNKKLATPAPSAKA